MIRQICWTIPFRPDKTSDCLVSQAQQSSPYYGSRLPIQGNELKLIEQSCFECGTLLAATAAGGRCNIIFISIPFGKTLPAFLPHRDVGRAIWPSSLCFVLRRGCDAFVTTMMIFLFGKRIGWRRRAMAQNIPEAKFWFVCCQLASYPVNVSVMHCNVNCASLHAIDDEGVGRTIGWAIGGLLS